MSKELTMSQLVGKPPLSKNDRTAIRKALIAIKDVLHSFGFRSEDAITKETVTHWESMAVDCGNWMKVAKYKLAAFYSFHNNQPIPEKPFKIEDSPAHLLGGAAYRWLRGKINDPKIKESLLQSIKQAKKGMPRPIESQLLQKTSEYVIAMTTAPKEKPAKPIHLVSWADINEIRELDGVETLLTIDTVKQQLRRTVTEIFAGEKMSWKERIEPFFPSTSANYINNRKQSGAVGYILEHEELLTGLRTPGGTLQVARGLKQPGESVQIEEEIQPEDFEEEMTYDRTDLNTRFKSLFWRIFKRAVHEEPLVEPVALAEALKIRMITKGPPLLMTILKNYWKAVFTRLKKHKTFQLIGKPVSEKIMLDGLGRNLGEAESYLSGDYAEATDNLFSWVSETIADQIKEELGLEKLEHALFQRALTEHIYEVDLKKLRQLIGQLMGSIVSFPVLCIANAAMCRWAIELSYLRKFLLKDAPLLINGDDCAMKGRTTTIKLHWGRLTTFIGLKESIGKTYLSREFVDINSTSFQRMKESFTIDDTNRTGATIKRETFLKQVKYVNIGLLYGLKRSGGKVGLNDQTDVHNNMAARARELLRLAPESLHEELMRMFIKHHKPLLDRMRLPWYIPEWLGGVGLPIGPWSKGISELDLRIAHRILLNWKKERPIPLSHQETPWKSWLLATSLLPEPYYVLEKDQSTAFYTETVATKCIDFLFDSNINIEKIHNVIQGEVEGAKAIKRNAKLWLPRAEALPAPLTIEEIMFQSRYPTWDISTAQRQKLSEADIRTGKKNKLLEATLD